MAFKAPKYVWEGCYQNKVRWEHYSLSGNTADYESNWQTYGVALWTVISRGSFWTSGPSGSRWASLAFISSLTFRSLQWKSGCKEGHSSHHHSSGGFSLFFERSQEPFLKGVKRLRQGQRLLLRDNGWGTATVSKEISIAPVQCTLTSKCHEQLSSLRWKYGFITNI